MGGIGGASLHFAELLGGKMRKKEAIEDLASSNVL